MKKLLPLFFIVLLFSLSAAAWGQKIELIEPQGVLTDYSGYISPAAREKINELAARLHNITSVNLRVVVVRQLDPIDPETYGRQLYDRWDIGQTREHLDHGVLLLISIVDRRVKLIVGKEVQSVMTPGIRDKVEWSVLAALSKGEFSEGTLTGAGAISHLIIIAWPQERAGLNINWSEASLPIFLLVIVAVGVTLITGSDLLMTATMLLGGLFGYLFLGTLGMTLFTALGFLLNYGQKKSTVPDLKVALADLAKLKKEKGIKDNYELGRKKQI